MYSNLDSFFDCNPSGPDPARPKKKTNLQKKIEINKITVKTDNKKYNCKQIHNN